MAERRIEPGPVVERALVVLREMPPVDGDTVSRVVAAAARARALDTGPSADDLLLEPAPPARYTRRVSIAAVAALLLTAGTLALWRATHVSSEAAHASIASAKPAVNAVTASRDLNNERGSIPTQFVFDGQARRVTLVGDFNNWDPRATPLEREPGSSLWSVTVPIQRGRHVYAFLVDSMWTIDRRAPVARDPDFGVTGSVILVGRP